MSLLLEPSHGSFDARNLLKKAVDKSFQIVSSSKSIEEVKRELKILSELVLPSVAALDDSDNQSLSSIYKYDEISALKRSFKEEHHVKTILGLILEVVLVNWYSVFTSLEKSSLVHVWIFTSSPILVLNEIALAIQKVSTKPKKEKNNFQVYLSFSSPNIASLTRIEHMKQITNIIKLYFGIVQDSWIMQKLKPINLFADLVTEISLLSSDTQLNYIWNNSLSIIGSLPERIYNIVKTDTDRHMSPKTWFTILSTILVKWMETICHKVNIDQFPFFSIWISKLNSIGHLDCVFKILEVLITTYALDNKDKFWPKALLSTLSNLPSSCLENFTINLLKRPSICKHEKLSDILLTLFLKPLEGSSTLRYIFSSKCFFSFSLPWNTTKHIINFLNKAFNTTKMPRNEYWIPMVIEMADMLSNAQFVKNSSFERQQLITRSLIYIFDQKMILKNDLEDTDLLIRLMGAVQEHLNSPSGNLIFLGMKLGESFSAILDPKNPLKFDYPDDTIIFPDDQSIPDSKTLNLDKFWKLEVYDPQYLDLILNAGESTENETYSNIDDLNEPTISDSDPNASFLDILDRQDREHASKQSIAHQTDSQGQHAQNSTMSTKEPFKKGKFVQQANLSEDLGKSKQTSSPLYLRDCITSLRSDDPNIIESTLSVLDILIDSRPDDLSEVSQSVASALLHLSNTYELDNFESKKHLALVSLVKYSPERIINYLVQQFYSPNYGLADRYQIIDVLTDGAQRLSEHTIADPRPEFNPVAVKRNLSIPAASKKQNKPTGMIFTHSSQIENNTAINLSDLDADSRAITPSDSSKSIGSSRRWASVQKPVQTFTNNIIPHINSFFNILNYKDVPSGSFNLLTCDTRLLGKVVYAVGVFFECAGSSAPNVAQLARKLSEFVWLVRYHEDPFVRRAVILSIQALITFSPAWVLFEDLANEIQEFYDWLEEASGFDSDDKVRQLGMIWLLTLSKIRRENPQYQIATY